MKRFVMTGLLGLAIAVLLVFVVDQAVLVVRIKHGTGYGSIMVNQFLTTPLKGQKEEYDLMGTAPVICVRSLFPQPGGQGWTPTCWWLARHTNQWN